MSFFRKAWYSGAEEYGKARAEKYGKIARLGNWIAFLSIMAFVGYCWHLGQQ